ncbi:MAG: AraC family transcriptional regulator [Bacteroidota bacterium]
MIQLTDNYSVHQYLNFVADAYKGKYETYKLESTCRFGNSAYSGSMAGIQLQPGISLIYNKLNIKEPCSYHQDSFKDYLKISFYRVANLEVVNGIGSYNLRKGYFKISLFDSPSDIQLKPRQECFESLDLIIRKGILKKVISNQPTLPFNIKKNLFGLINKSSRYKIYPVNMKLKTILDQIWDNKEEGIFKLLSTQSLVCELLKLLIVYNEKTNLEVKTEDQKRMESAKKILETNYRTPPTIAQLARHIGMNEQKLKKMFKDYFQTTIHQYVHNIKMKYSWNMISSDQYTVNEIADKIGYCNTSKFIAAFKNKFGITPGKLIAEKSMI